MSKFTIYLSDRLERDIRAASRESGFSMTEVLRKRIQASYMEQNIERIEDKIDAIFALMELILGDVGYIAGATRAGTKNHEAASKEGAYYEAQFRRNAATARRIFSTNHKSEMGQP